MDVPVLNEYVHGESRAAMLPGREGIGLSEVSMSPRILGQNQILIASRSPQNSGDLAGPMTTSVATVNFLHVAAAGIEIMGMRAPAFTNHTQLEEYWQETERLIMATMARRVIFIGDTNCDPERRAKREVVR